MCGIAGYIASASIGPWFSDVLETLRHRGPDGDGVWFPGSDQVYRVAELRSKLPELVPAALGHLRLSILDLTDSGAQPMRVPGRATVILNGEIYNYLELRNELNEAGWQFESSSDTEVLLKGWLQWGNDLMAKMNGMWAFAIWDEERQGMLLSRDRFGEKPLFMKDWKGGVAFASEIKALLRFPDVDATLDCKRVARFLHSSRVYDGTNSWFEGISQLKPGTAMWISADERKAFNYYDLEHEVAHVQSSQSDSEWVERLSDSFDRSVRIRMRSDVPVGGCLSEGIDSSLVLMTAVGFPVASNFHTFTLGSNDKLIDERRGAEILAKQVGAQWHGLLADGVEFANVFDQIIWHQESALPTTSLYGQWKVFQSARAEGVPVLLDGQGADEILGGYTKFFIARLRSLLSSNPLEAIRGGVHLARHLGSSPKLLKYGHRYMPWSMGHPDIPGLCRAIFDSDDAVMPSVSGSVLDMRLSDVNRWSLPNLLSYEDRNAMAHSIETRLPFLDPRVVELSLAMPENLIFEGGWTKWPFRQMLADKGASEVAWKRGKRQFSVPQADWLRGDLRPLVEELFNSPHPLWEEIVHMDKFRSFQKSWTKGLSSQAWDDTCFHLLSIDRFLKVYFP